MKNLLNLLLISLFLGCAKNNDNTLQQENKLIGTWQEKEFLGVGKNNTPPPILIENGYIIKFNKDLTFSSDEYSNSSSGTYSVSSDNIITLNFARVNEPTITRTKKIEEITDKTLILKPTDRSCDEGCGEKLLKIK